MAKAQFVPEAFDLIRQELESISRSVGDASDIVTVEKRRLNNFSGYGIEQLINRLENTANSLGGISRELMYESAALVKIYRNITECDVEVNHIFGGNAVSEYISDTSGNSGTSSNKQNNSPKSFLSNVSDWFKKKKEGIKKTIDEALDYAGKGYDLINEILKKAKINVLDKYPIFDMIDIRKYFDTFRYSISDLKITTDELVNIIGLAPAAFKGVQKIIETAYGVDFIRNTITLSKGSSREIVKAAKGVASWAPAVGALVTAFVSGYDAYKEAKADGVITDRERAGIGIEAGVDGLAAVGIAALTLACPIAGAGVALIYAIADNKFDFGKLISDSLLDMVDNASSTRYNSGNYNFNVNNYYSQSDYPNPDMQMIY